MEIRASIYGVSLIALVICASIGCTDDNGTGPSYKAGVAIATGTFVDEEDGSEVEARFRITFESIEELRDLTGGDEAVRDITTRPVRVSVSGGNEFLAAAAAGLESEQLRLRYRRRSDGVCDVVATMTSAAGAADRYNLSWNARYRENIWLGSPAALDDVLAASGAMRVLGIEGDVRRSAVSRDIVVSIRGMKSLVEGFEE